MAISKVGSLDRYTAAHAMLGWILGIWGAPWPVALGTTLVFERIEDSLKQIAPGLFPVGDPDTPINSALDSAAWMAGWGLAQLHRPQPAKMWQRRRLRRGPR